jgi:hypothetical protein
MADESKKRKATDLQPLASPSVLLNNHLQQWGIKSTVSMSSSGPAHSPTWSAATNTTSLLQFDPPAETFTSSNKNAAARKYHQNVLMRVQAADLLGRQFAPGDFMRSVSVSDDSNFIDLCTDQAVAGRALILIRPSRGEYKHGTFEDEVHAFGTRNKGGHVGFDAERDIISSRTTLLQIADEIAVLLFRPAPTCKMLPTCLNELLTDKDIQKTAVDFQQDDKYLRVDFGLDCNPAVDLQVKAAKYGFEHRVSTELLASYFLNVDIKKDKGVKKRFSESLYDQNLTTQHKKYGAVDAIIAYELGRKLTEIEENDDGKKWKRRVVVGAI